MIEVLAAIATYFLWKKIIIPFAKSHPMSTEELKENYVFLYGYDYDYDHDDDDPKTDDD